MRLLNERGEGQVRFYPFKEVGAERVSAMLIGAGTKGFDNFLKHDT